MSAKLCFHVISVFPEMIDQALKFGVVSQALKTGLLELKTVSPRGFTSNVHQTIDDRPFGGGDGMVMMPEPMSQAFHAVREAIGPGRTVRTIHLSPRGQPLDDQRVRALAKEYSDLILIASRYAGLDQRFVNEFVDEEISLGDYVVSGGELPALVLIDAVSRCVPGVLGNEASPHDESFAPGLKGLEFPQFTRPRDWHGAQVPEALLSGDHAKVAAWKVAVSILVTALHRPELLQVFSAKDLASARNVLDKMSAADVSVCGLESRTAINERLDERLASRGV